MKLRLHRRTLICLVAFIYPFLPELPGALAEEATRPRNIILILSDDHRFDFMSFMGRPDFLQTPNLDRMAREGLHFRNAFVTTSLCSPSRASILTGLYAHRHGVVDNNTLIPPGTRFFPQALQENGVQTAFIGKWHMGHNSDEPRPGFNHWISYRGQGTYFDPVLNVNGERVERKGYTADIVTDYALKWIQKQEEEPFFLMLSHKSVHAMFEPSKRHLGKYEDTSLEYPETMADTEENYGDKPRWVRRQRNSWHGVDYMYHGQMDFNTFYRRYCETLLGLDESIGRILDFLESSGLDKDTLVIYMSDNGFSFGEHGLIDKRHMYEESIRIPMLAYAPGYIEGGTETNELILNIDIAPTLLDFSGVASEQTDGRSFLPILEQEPAEWRDAIFYEYYWEWNFPQTPTIFGVRTDRYKYIFYHGIWDIDELYDVRSDPLEKHNLAYKESHKDIKLNLRQRLFEHLAQTGGMKILLRPPVGFRAAQSRD